MPERRADRSAWFLTGPFRSGHESAGLTAALRNLHLSEHRAPTPEDAPPVSTLPHTAASREAVRLNREADERLKAGRHRRTYGEAV